MSNSYSGTNRIFPIFAAPADTLGVSSVALDVQTDVIGDGDSLEDEHGEGASTAAVVDNNVTPPSSWSPPANMVSTFNSLVGIDADMWGETKRIPVVGGHLTQFLDGAPQSVLRIIGDGYSLPVLLLFLYHLNSRFS